jgi:excisionase family DNA binding protein
MLPQTLSVNEAAKYLKVKPRTVREWIANGKLAAARVGRFYVIPLEEVGRLITPQDPIIEINTGNSERKAHAARLKELLRGASVCKESIRAARRRDAELEPVRVGNH